MTMTHVVQQFRSYLVQIVCTVLAEFFITMDSMAGLIYQYIQFMVSSEYVKFGLRSRVSSSFPSGGEYLTNKALNNCCVSSALECQYVA